jgi:hypothetical protein
VYLPIVAGQQLGKIAPIIARQRLGEKVTAATNKHAAITELLEAPFVRADAMTVLQIKP